MSGGKLWALVRRSLRKLASDRTSIIGGLLALLFIMLSIPAILYMSGGGDWDPLFLARSVGWQVATGVVEMYAMFLGIMGIPLEMRSGRANPILARPISRELYYAGTLGAGAVLLAGFELARSSGVFVWIFAAGGSVTAKDFLGIGALICGYWLFLAQFAFLGTAFGPGYGTLAGIGSLIISMGSFLPRGTNWPAFDILGWFFPRPFGQDGRVESLLRGMSLDWHPALEVLLYRGLWTALLVMAGMVLFARKEIPPR